MIEHSKPPLVISLSVRIYATLLICYPAAYRREYGAHMVQIFQDVSCNSFHHQGLAGIVFWWCSALFDLILTAIEQRKEGKTTMLKSTPIKGSGLGLMCLIGGVIYLAGGLWLSVSGVPTDYYGIQLTHLLRMMWAGGATCGLMGLMQLGATDDGTVARAAAWLAGIGFVSLEIDALLALISHSTITIFAGSALPFSNLLQVILLFGWVALTVIILRERRWSDWTRLAPLAMLLAPCVAVLGIGFLPVIAMGFALILLGFAVQSHMNKKRRMVNGTNALSIG